MSDPKYRPAILSLCDYSGTWSRPFLDKGYVVIRVDPKHDGVMPYDNTGYITGCHGSGIMRKMDDGGYSLAWTAGALAAALKEEGGYCLDERVAYFDETVSADGAGPFTTEYQGVEVVGILIAAPCTDFANSGARWFADKDADGRTQQSISIVNDCLLCADLLAPDWWVLENPVGRIQRLVPRLGDPIMRFDPCDYAGFADEPMKEAYTKKTVLYGEGVCTKLPKAPIEPVFYYKTRRDGTKVRGSWQWAKLGGKSERTKELRSMTPIGFSRAFAEANG